MIQKAEKLLGHLALRSALGKGADVLGQLSIFPIILDWQASLEV